MLNYDETTHMFIKPKEGSLLRTPKNKTIIPVTGAVVPKIGPEGRYWRRRVKDGDAIIVPKVSQPEAAKSKQRKGGNN